jgi:hypothetical protein
MVVGSKAQVWHGTADKTSGGLSKKDLMKNKHGRIISRRKHALGQKSAKKHLFAAGYKPKKGTFKLFRRGDSKKATRKQRGGYADAAAMEDTDSSKMGTK